MTICFDFVENSSIKSNKLWKSVLFGVFFKKNYFFATKNVVFSKKDVNLQAENDCQRLMMQRLD